MKNIKTIMETKNYIDSMLALHENQNLPEGVFSTSVEVANLIGKEHYNVLRDIDDFIKSIQEKDRSNFEGTSKETQSSNIYKQPADLVREVQQEDRFNFGGYSKNPLSLGKKWYFAIDNHYDRSGRLERVYYLSRIGFLALISYYRGSVAYLLTKHYFALEDMLNSDKGVSEYELLYFTPGSILYDVLSYLDNKKLSERGHTEHDRNIGKEKMEHYLRSFARDRRRLNDPNYYILFEKLGMKYKNNDFNQITSIELSKLFGKKHFHIMRDIRDILNTLQTDGVELDPENFKLSNYKDSYGRSQSVYVLDKIGVVTLMTRYFKELNLTLAEYFVESELYLIPIMEKYLNYSYGKLNAAFRVVNYRNKVLPYPTSLEYLYNKEEEKEYEQMFWNEE